MPMLKPRRGGSKAIKKKGNPLYSRHSRVTATVRENKPNAVTLAALRSAQKLEGTRFSSADEFFEAIGLEAADA